MPGKMLTRVFMGFSFSLVIAFSYPYESHSQTLKNNNPAEYIVEDIHGNNVQVLEGGTKEWEQTQEGQVLENGDEIKTGTDSEATLMLQSETSVHLSPGSDLKVGQVEPNENSGFVSRLELLFGGILADVKKNLQDSHSTFEVDSNGVVCGVRGTAFEVETKGDNVLASTHEGNVEVTGSNGVSRTVSAGTASSFQRGMFRLERRLDRKQIERFEKWREFRGFVMKKRMRRIEALRHHLRKPWKRRHPMNGNNWKKKMLNRRPGFHPDHT